jgi:hypothetical protein
MENKLFLFIFIFIYFHCTLFAKSRKCRGLEGRSPNFTGMYILPMSNNTAASLRLQLELEFLKSLWGLGTEEEEGYRTGPPGYIGWRNSFLGIDSGAPYTFKNTGSD